MKSDFWGLPQTELLHSWVERELIQGDLEGEKPGGMSGSRRAWLNGIACCLSMYTKAVAKPQNSPMNVSAGGGPCQIEPQQSPEYKGTRSGGRFCRRFVGSHL